MCVCAFQRALFPRDCSSKPPPKKMHSPLRPTVKMQKCAHQNTTCTSSPNCMPPSTLPSILKRCARTAISTSNSTPNSTPISTYTSTPNRTPPSTRPSISQITFPFLLEARTPIAFSYLGKKSSWSRPKQKNKKNTGVRSGLLKIYRLSGKFTVSLPFGVFSNWEI